MFHEAMRDLVAYCENKGLSVVPLVQSLGHAESGANDRPDVRRGLDPRPENLWFTLFGVWKILLDPCHCGVIIHAANTGRSWQESKGHR